MPLDSAEGFNAALAGLGIGEEVLVIVNALPPKDVRKAVDYAPILTLISTKVLPLIDQLETDIAD